MITHISRTYAGKLEDFLGKGIKDFSVRVMYSIVFKGFPFDRGLETSLRDRLPEIRGALLEAGHSTITVTRSLLVSRYRDKPVEAVIAEGKHFVPVNRHTPSEGIRFYPPGVTDGLWGLWLQVNGDRLSRSLVTVEANLREVNRNGVSLSPAQREIASLRARLEAISGNDSQAIAS
jgi:hypothetical protein